MVVEENKKDFVQGGSAKIGVLQELPKACISGLGVGEGGRGREGAQRCHRRLLVGAARGGSSRGGLAPSPVTPLTCYGGGEATLNVKRRRWGEMSPHSQVDGSPDGNVWRR